MEYMKILLLCLIRKAARWRRTLLECSHHLGYQFQRIEVVIRRYLVLSPVQGTIRKDTPPFSFYSASPPSPLAHFLRHEKYYVRRQTVVDHQVSKYPALYPPKRRCAGTRFRPLSVCLAPFLLSLSSSAGSCSDRKKSGCSCTLNGATHLVGGHDPRKFVCGRSVQAPLQSMLGVSLKSLGLGAGEH